MVQMRATQPWSRLCLLTACVCLLAEPVAGAADEQSLEYQVKAAFLFNFTKFVEWPSAALRDEFSPISICILGPDPFGSSLDRLVAGETAQGHKLVVERLRGTPAPKACQVLYVSRTDRNLPRILNDLAPGVLTVGEGQAFVRQGGIIGFVLENRRVRFDINTGAAEKASLKISSRLLSVANSVFR